jgi:hypothetical protein
MFRSLLIITTSFFLLSTTSVLGSQKDAADVMTDYFSKVIDLCAAASSAKEPEANVLRIVDDMAGYICRNIKTSDLTTVNEFREASRSTCSAAYRCGNYNEVCKNALKRGISAILHKDEI